MPSTYIVITRKTLQSLPNSFANPLANWFFHLSSYVRVSYEHIYIYIYICYIFQCLYFGWKNEKKKKKKERQHRQATSSVTRKNHLSVRESFGSRTRCTRHFDPFANDARSFGAFLPSPPPASRVESRRGARRIRGCVDRKENIRKWNRRSKLFLFSSAFRSQTKCFTETSRLKVVPKFSFFFLRLVSSSSDSSNVLRMEKIYFRIYEK